MLMLGPDAAGAGASRAAIDAASKAGGAIAAVGPGRGGAVSGKPISLLRTGEGRAS